MTDHGDYRSRGALESTPPSQLRLVQLSRTRVRSRLSEPSRSESHRDRMHLYRAEGPSFRHACAFFSSVPTEDLAQGRSTTTYLPPVSMERSTSFHPPTHSRTQIGVVTTSATVIQSEGANDAQDTLSSLSEESNSDFGSSSTEEDDQLAKAKDFLRNMLNGGVVANGAVHHRCRPSADT